MAQIWSWFILLFSLCFLSCAEEKQVTVPDITIVPRPLTIEKKSTVFILNQKTKLAVSSHSDILQALARPLAEKLRTATGYPFKIRKRDSGGTRRNTVHLILTDTLFHLDREGYRLSIDEKKAVISAHQPAGLFYGLQTFRQLLPPAVESDSVVAGADWVLPAVVIEDKPRFDWRGMHLDVGRHFFPVAFIKKYIDLIVAYKLNRFHWHLTEDQGWRIEIKRYPGLTKIGSRRKETNGDGKPYGGFYTQDEIRNIVAYAGERFVTIVPEIEMPGHSRAALAVFPELSCTGGPFSVGSNWGIYRDVFCAGNERTFIFLENVLTEVFGLFPGEYVHVGGDECPKYRWKNCPECQHRMREENLSNENALQSYFISRMDRFLHDHSKRLIGWDEILEGGLAPHAVVMSWRGVTAGIAAARAGHDVVMSPVSHCYFDYYQSRNREDEPEAFNAYLPLEKVYEFEPVPDVLSRKEAKHILGAQGNMWTEYMDNARHVEYMLLPRMCALSEVVWSDPKHRDFKDFNLRMETHYKRFEMMNVHYRKFQNND